MQQTIETKNSSNFTVVAAAVKSFNDIKIHDEKPNTYYDHERSRYDAFIYQMNHVFQTNEGLETTKESKLHKIIFATSYLQKGALNVWMIVLRNAENDTRFFIWEIVKVLLYRYVREVKSLDQNIYTKWISVEQSFNQSITQYDIYLVNLKSHFLAELKPSEFQIMTNFKRNFRLNHKRKILKQSAKLNMKNLIDQIMNFEKDEKLDKKISKKKKILKKMRSRKSFLINNNVMILAETEIASEIIRIEVEIEKTTSIEKNEVKIIQMIVISTSSLLLTTSSNDSIASSSINRAK